MNTVLPTMNRVLTVNINNLGESSHLTYVDSANALSSLLSTHFSSSPNVQEAFHYLYAGMTNAFQAQAHSDDPLKNLGKVVFVYDATSHALVMVLSSVQATFQHFNASVNVVRTMIENKHIFRE